MQPRQTIAGVAQRTHAPENALGCVLIGGDMLMTRPKPCSSMWGRQACVMAKVPRELMPVMRSYLLPCATLRVAQIPRHR